MPAWVFPLIIFGVVIFFGDRSVLMWIGSRGRFIFTDCIVRNRGAIAEPWREFRREGNSFFLFSLIVAGSSHRGYRARLSCQWCCRLLMDGPVARRFRGHSGLSF